MALQPTAQLISKTFIKATNNDEESYTVPISNFDRLSGRAPVTIFYAYRQPPSADFASILAVLKNSVSNILSFFPPFAGRVVTNPKTGEPEILCNNKGVELMAALAYVPLKTLDFHNLDLSIKTFMLPSDGEVPLSLQVTSYTCGGFSITWSFDHLIADGAGFIKFLSLWSELARTQLLSEAPDHNRSIFDRWRCSAPMCSPSLDRIFTECTMDQILASLPVSTIKRLYYVEGSCIDHLRATSSKLGSRATRTEAVSAHLWKLLANSVGSREPICKMGWLVDGRPRIASVGSNYVGNLVSTVVGEARTRELKDWSLAEVAAIVAETIKEVTNEAHFEELSGWIERHKPAPVLPRIALGLDGPGVLVSSCHHMPAMEVDFGFGAPVVGTFYTTLEALGVNYVSFFPSGKGDGSWIVFAFVSPSLAGAMDLDPDRVFRPVTFAHLGL